MRSRALSLTGTGLFLLIAPGTVAAYIPWYITRWQFSDDLGGLLATRVAGAVLIVLGGLCLLECYIRFAWIGIGTPAPIAPTRRLVVSGLYRHVRNPMYLSVGALVLGQALLFNDRALILYALILAPIFHLMVLFYEEPALRRQFPHDYAAFIKAVPRWLPRLRPWRGASQ